MTTIDAKSRQTPEVREAMGAIANFLPAESQAEIVKILTVGEEFKKQGEEMKEKYWKNSSYSSWEEFRVYARAYEARKIELEQKNKEKLEEIGYFNFPYLLRDKFIQEYLKDNILYDKTITPKEEKLEIKGLKEILKFLEEQGGLTEGVTISLHYEDVLDEEAEVLAQAIEKAGGLIEGVVFYFRKCRISIDGLKYLINAIESTGGFREGCEINLSATRMYDDGAQMIAQAIEKTGGLGMGIYISLYNNNIGPDGVQAIINAIEKTGGLGVGTVINLENNRIGDKMREKLKTLNEKLEGKIIYDLYDIDK